MDYRVHVWSNGFCEEYEPTHMKLLNFQQESRTRLDSKILRLSQRPSCSEYIHKKYIKDVLAQNTILVVMYHDQDPKGFIIAQPLTDGGIYLDVLCAEGGAVLLRFFLGLMERQGADYVELNSLINVLAYYPQFGFEHRLSCNDNGKTPLRMSLPLAEHLKRAKKTRRLRTYKNYYKDPAMMQFVDELHHRGFTRTRYPLVCQNRDLRSKNFQQHHCARDGFAMRKCFRRSTRRNT
jgi:hypothetical protein